MSGNGDILESKTKQAQVLYNREHAGTKYHPEAQNKLSETAIVSLLQSKSKVT